MKEPERNRRGMQQRSGLLATISERAPPARVTPNSRPTIWQSIARSLQARAHFNALS